VNVGNRGRGSGYGSVTINSNNFPTGGGGMISFTDPELFDRWRGAGGTVTGGEVVTSTHSVRLNVHGTGSGTGDVNAVLDRIPFEGEEVSELTVRVTAPTTGLAGQAAVEPPTLMIQQWVDGQSVGGNILRPPVHVYQVYLPVVRR